GLMASTGTVDSGPTRIGVALVDMSTGLYACVGILMALAERTKSGLGQFVEATLYETGLAIMHPHTSNYFYNGGKPPTRTGNEHPNLYPYAVFAARDGDIFVGVGNDATYRKLCKELGRPELGTDPRFARNRDRVVNRDKLRAELEAILTQEDGEPLCRRLLAAGLPAGPVQSIDKALTNSHTLARGDVIEKDWYKGVASPVRFERTPASLRRVPPKFSEHALELLGEFGYTAEEISDLLAKGTVSGQERKR
ncbi:MAG TPA: CaiB/BaiF CoA-transferase family protein, partial [Rhodopseudomonas sp.]|uniref:CaiB/BaiF CoA transferase family protein n=1 Tax=Rhodopseudomonas sp. TaxID=1078 RepID=UPI002EDB93A3